jgi:hypothetical protein
MRGCILAVQDQVIPTKNYRRGIIKEALEEDIFRKLGRRGSTVELLNI